MASSGDNNFQMINRHRQTLGRYKMLQYSFFYTFKEKWELLKKNPNYKKETLIHSKS